MSPSGSLGTRSGNSVSPEDSGDDVHGGGLKSVSPSTVGVHDTSKSKHVSLHGHHVYGHVSNESFTYLGIPPSFFNTWQKGKAEGLTIEELLGASESDSLENILASGVVSQLLPDAHTLNLECVPKATDALLAYMKKIGSSCVHIEKVVLRGCRYVILQ
jgi:hypothetical protein